MIEIFKTLDNEQKLVKIDRIEKGCWINITAPSEEELNYIQSNLNVLPDFLRDALDEEEKPRIDIEDNQILIIVDAPYVYKKDNEPKFDTIPIGLLILNDYFVSICLRETEAINIFKLGKVKDFYTYYKTRFTLQILSSIAKEFLKGLRYIDKKSKDVEEILHKSMRNKELFKLLDLEKSLVFFTTSLKSNEVVMEKVLRGKFLKMYEEDQDLLEDVIIENKQAIEMASIYSSILSSTTDTLASVISNNLNIVMKFLTSVTIVMSIPTMVASFFGMNIKLPFAPDDPFALIYVLIISLAMSLVAIYALSKRQMF